VLAAESTMFSQAKRKRKPKEQIPAPQARPAAKRGRALPAAAGGLGGSAPIMKGVLP